MALLAFDTETTGLEIYTKHKIFSYSLCDKNGKTEVCRLDGPHAPRFHAKLQKLFDDKNTLVMHNAKFDLGVVEQYLGRHLAENTFFHDTMIQAHIMDNYAPSKELKELAWVLAGIDKTDEQKVNQFVKGGADYSMVPEFIMDEYQRKDAERTMLLHLFFWPKISSNPRFKDVYQTEIDLIKTTLRMEERGLMLNVPQTLKLIEELKTKVDLAINEIAAIAGKRMKPTDNNVRWLLFNKLNMPVLSRTATGLPQVDKNVLMALREDYSSPALEAILKYRSYSKGITTLEKYLGFADGNNIIHPSIQTCGAKTSRESCSKPNLQNVAKDQVLLNPYPIPARQAFRPRPGYVNFHIDYSGIEYRLGVHYSDEPRAIEMIRNGEDGHAFAAEVFYGQQYRDAQGVDKKVLRNAAKNGNFLILYAGSAKALSRTLGVSIAHAERAFKEYARALPLYCGLNRKVAGIVREQGYVETAFGRVLRMPKSKSYMATNYLIQGTAAGILKRAQVRVHKYLEQATGGDAKILLPIHDEIVIEFPRKMLPEAKHIFKHVRELMIDFDMFKVPLEVEVEIATTDWAHKKEFKL